MLSQPHLVFPSPPLISPHQSICTNNTGECRGSLKKGAVSQLSVRSTCIVCEIICGVMLSGCINCIIACPLAGKDPVHETIEYYVCNNAGLISVRGEGKPCFCVIFKLNYNTEIKEYYMLLSLCFLSRSTPEDCLLYTSPSPRDRQKSRMPSSA